jgi:hypothetical protein
MNNEELIGQIDRLIERSTSTRAIEGVYAEVCEFLRRYAGPKSEFFLILKGMGLQSWSYEAQASSLQSFLTAFRAFVEAGLHSDVSPERRAQLDVVSDFLEQAQQLLATSGIHPAAPAVIIGAALEEFLRTWIESEGLSLGARKRGLDTYAQVLRENESITKQDQKDITSWAGLRNQAAHGQWDEVNDKKRILIMLEGVNLFMRRHST